MSGEKQDGREHIDRSARYLIEKGGFKPDVAVKKATEARIREEQRRDGIRK